jgi:hypothetical protein
VAKSDLNQCFGATLYRLYRSEYAMTKIEPGKLGTWISKTSWDGQKFVVLSVTDYQADLMDIVSQNRFFVRIMFESNLIVSTHATVFKRSSFPILDSGQLGSEPEDAWESL